MLAAGSRARPASSLPGGALELVRELLADVAPAGPSPALVDAVEHLVDVVLLDLRHRAEVEGLAHHLAARARAPAAERQVEEGEERDEAPEEHKYRIQGRLHSAPAALRTPAYPPAGRGPHSANRPNLAQVVAAG